MTCGSFRSRPRQPANTHKSEPVKGGSFDLHQRLVRADNRPGRVGQNDLIQVAMLVENNRFHLNPLFAVKQQETNDKQPCWKWQNVCPNTAVLIWS